MEKGLIKIKEFVEGELEDYGFFDYKETKFNEQEGLEYYYDVSIICGHEHNIKELHFMYDEGNDEIHVRHGEENYELVNEYDWRVKHFWMALLKWDY